MSNELWQIAYSGVVDRVWGGGGSGRGKVRLTKINRRDRGGRRGSSVCGWGIMCLDGWLWWKFIDPDSGEETLVDALRE